MKAWLWLHFSVGIRNKAVRGRLAAGKNYSKREKLL